MTTNISLNRPQAKALAELLGNNERADRITIEPVTSEVLKGSIAVFVKKSTQHKIVMIDPAGRTHVTC